MIAAASPVVTFGNRDIVLPVPDLIEKIWIIFRASGRLVWPAVYVLLFGACRLLSGFKREKTVSVFLLCCALIQGFDISAEAWDRGKPAREPAAFVSELQDKGWEIPGGDPRIENIVYVNVSGLRSCASMAEFADSHHKTLGKFYYARDYEKTIERSVKEALREKRGTDIFLFDSGRMIDAWNEPDLYYYMLDGKLLAYREALSGLNDKKIDPREYEYSWEYENMEGSENTEMIDGFLFVHGGGMAVSETFPLPKGSYRFILEGENLMDAKLSLSGKGQIREHGMQTVTGILEFSESGSFRVGLKNPSDHDMVLYRIRLRPLA